MDLNELIKLIKENNHNADEELIKKAYELAKSAHKGQKRISGEEFLEHPVGVAAILAKQKADTATIVAAILHDVLEDTPVKLEQIKKEFGQEIAALVEGVTKIDKFEFEKREEYKAENYRKILLASAKDIRVMLIKISDRLHNMRTLKYLRPDKQKRIAEETLHVYAPIAYKLGMGIVKGELEDLSLRFIEPKVYQYLKARISEKRQEREKKTQQIIEMVHDELEKSGIKTEIQGRAKFFYSIYMKMKKEKISFDDIYDLIALRIVTKTIPECYKAIDIVHAKWDTLPHRVKDYIKEPKPNGYQSLHTTVKGPFNKLLEIQVRTDKMHDYAEEGIAAHWKYKGKERDKKFEQKISWIKQLLDWRRKSKDAKDILEDLSFDLFADEIVVFTPKGDPISLPEQSTPIDFSFEVHTNLGLQCSKCKVNGKNEPLDHPLESGDVVDIITQKNAKPSRQWLSFVKSSLARAKIRQALGLPPDKPRKELGPDEERQFVLVDQIEIIGKKSPIKLSKCCFPKPGDKIIGFYTKDKKITVHKNTCANVRSLENARKADLKWKKLEDKYEKELIIVAHDKPGFIRQVLNEITSANIIIKSIHTRNSKGHIVLEIKMNSPNELKNKDLLKKVRRFKETLDVRMER